MRIIKTLIFILFVVIFSACSHRQSTLSIIANDFADPVKIALCDTICNGVLFEPFSLIYHDSLWITYNSYMGENQIFVYDEQTQTQYAFLKKGRAYGEAVHINSIQIYNDSLFVNIDPDKIFVYPFNSLRHNLVHMPACVFDGIKGLYLGNGQSMSIPAFPQPVAEKMYGVYSRDCVPAFFGDYPVDDEVKYPDHDYSRQTAYQGQMYLSPDGEKALNVFHYAVGFDIIDINRRTVDHVFWKYPQVSVEYVDLFKANFVKAIPERERGFVSGCARQNGFYLLYDLIQTSGLNESHIFKYAWDCTPLHHYLIKGHRILCFYINDEEDRLYTVEESANSTYMYLSYKL